MSRTPILNTFYKYEEQQNMDTHCGKSPKWLFLFCAVVVLSIGGLFACRQEADNSADPIASDFTNPIASADSALSLFAPRTGETVRDIIYNAILNREDSCDLSGFRLSEAEFSADYDLWQLINENPAISYLESYSWYTQWGIVIKITMEYKSIPADYNTQLERAVTLAIAYIKDQLQENYRQAELVCAISDYIALHCQYAYKPDGVTPDDDNSLSAYSALVEQRAVCDGYANAFTLLAQTFGLEVIKVSGIAEPGSANHAWNMVKVDGIWYHVDVTWNDPTPDTPGYAGHEYLLLSDQAISNPRGQSRQYHGSWDTTAPSAPDTRYDDAFWIYENTPISFKTMNYDEWTQMIAQTSFEEVIVTAVENDTEANVARFGYNAEQIDKEIRELYPYIGYTYTENSNGIVIKISNWLKN